MFLKKLQHSTWSFLKDEAFLLSLKTPKIVKRLFFILNIINQSFVCSSLLAAVFPLFYLRFFNLATSLIQLMASFIGSSASENAVL